LRDVLGFPSSEVADMLGSTVESVNSALKRARASLERRRPAADLEPPPAPDSYSEKLTLGSSSAHGSPPISTRLSLS
jgi:hypothetical protein